jgi:hypothetical protein
MKAFEEKPARQVLAYLNMLGYSFILTTIAATIAWIYYVAKAVDQGQIGGNEGRGSADTGDPTTTAETMYQATVISIFLYFIFRHHFSK